MNIDLSTNTNLAELKPMIDGFKNRLFLASLRYDVSKPISFTSEEELFLKRLFWYLYRGILASRGSVLEISEKETFVLSQIFLWCIGSIKFKGDIKKGLWICSKQGFGKDVILSTIVLFFRCFDKEIKELSFSGFNMEWYEKVDAYFRMPIKINDVHGDGRIKRERESIPILEFLDFREQTNNRRGILISSNYLPLALQAELEAGKNIQRLEQRIIGCCNVIVIKDAVSKRKGVVIEI